MKHTRVNIHCNAVKAPVSEVRNGRQVIRVASATLPDNVVMNEIMYPKEEIENSYMGLEGKPAPFGHPQVNGMYVSAMSPEGINAGWVGAWNVNVRRENGRVFLDKVIDVEVASQTANGRRLMEALNAKKPIHTSTGVLVNLEDAPEGAEYSYIARNMEFDHDAILLDEPGAATPEQGVGMMVNKAGEEIEVVNSFLEDEADFDFERAAEIAVRAADRMQKAGMIARLKAAMMDALSGTTSGETSANTGDAEMTDKVQFDALSSKVSALEEAMGNLPNTVTEAVNAAIKPVSDHVASLEANQKASTESERKGYVDQIVQANLLDQESADELTLNAARKLAEKAQPGAAAPINGAFRPNSEADAFAYDMNATMGLGSDKKEG